MEVLTVLIALAFGFLLGALVGANRAFRLVRSARRIRGAHSRIARFMPDDPPTRTSADILAGRVRVRFGGLDFELPVLPRNASRKWLADLDTSFATLALALEEAGDDAPQILALLSTQTELMYGALLAYDVDGVLPSRDELDEIATDAEVLQATLEVWRAANPLVAVVAETSPWTTSTPAAPPSSSPRTTAGDPTTSSDSPTSSSSSTSTSPTSGSSPVPLFASRSKSKPSGSATSSPATDAPTSDGPAAPASAIGGEG